MRHFLFIFSETPCGPAAQFSIVTAVLFFIQFLFRLHIEDFSRNYYSDRFNFATALRHTVGPALLIMRDACGTFLSGRVV